MSSAGSDRPTRRVLDPERVHAAFVAARAREPAERDSVLEEHCAGDDELRREVEELLAHDSSAGAFLQDPVWRNLAQSLLAELHPGEVVGEYLLDGFIGRGGTSRVFSAIQRDSGRRVALKVVSLGALGPRVRDRFLREVAIATAMRHPHLVEIFCSGEDQDRGLLYCAMRLVDGPNLAEVLDEFAREQRHPDPNERRELIERFAEVAAGLAALHAQGLVHRDVKPANIVCDAGQSDDPRRRPAVLVDFGLVVDTAAHQGAVSTLWASFDYAAPEQLLGRSVSPAADVFALGVTMHDLLAGRLPVSRARTPAEGLEAIGALVPGIEGDLAAIVSMACDPEPRWRYPDASALRDDLRAFLDRRRVRAAHVPLAVRLGRSALRHPRRAVSFAARWSLGLLAGVILTVVAEQIWTAWQLRDATTAAFHVGDFAETERLTRRPGLIQNWFLPDSILRRIAAGNADSDAALVAVFESGRREGWEKALILAACHLERDGISRHPELARFLHSALVSNRPVDVLPLVARLFYERPNDHLEDDLATAGFRDALHTRLVGSRPTDSMDALVALGGCGDSESFVRCVQALTGWTRRDADPELAECERVAVANLAMLIRRVVHLRPAARSRVLELEATVIEAVRRARLHARASRVSSDRLDQAAGQLALQFARLRRGDPEVEFVAQWQALLQRSSANWFRAARGDLGFVQGVLRGELEMYDEGSERMRALGGRMLASDLGYLAGLLEDSECTAGLRERARAAGSAVIELETLFESGFQSGVRTLAGLDGPARPDADSHLGRALQGARRAEEVAGIAAELPARTVAAWDFCVPEVAVTAPTNPIVLCDADLQSDEYGSSSGFARFLLPGISEVRLSFDAAAVPGGLLNLHIEAQKAVRAALPMDGSVGLDVLVDGVPVVRDAMLPGSSAEHLELPLCDASLPRHRMLTLRLSDRSTTTLRVYRVRVGW